MKHFIGGFGLGFIITLLGNVKYSKPPENLNDVFGLFVACSLIGVLFGMIAYGFLP